MLQPKKTKFRKMQKGRIKGYAYKGSQIAFGSFGLKCLEPKFITSRQIEAARVAITRYMKREGQLWVAVCEPGRIVFEVEGVSEAVAKEALRLGAQKMPCLLKFITRHDYVAE